MLKSLFNVPVYVRRQGGFDLYGQAVFGPRIPTMCAVVKLVKSSQHTTVRTDSGGTHGRADEFVADAKILLPPGTQIDIGDRIDMADGFVSIEAKSIQPRYTALGRLDHLEIVGTIA